MAENLVVKVVAETRNALKGLGKVDKAAKGTGKSFLSLGKAVGVAGAAFGVMTAVGVSKFMSEATKLALIQEEAERKLATALGRTSQELLTYASALQRKTTFGDEEILSAQSMIASFIKEEEQIKALTPAILDLATAKGMDLTSAADLVTKSVASSTNALARYGIQIEGEAGSTERITDTVNALTDAFGGMAEGMAQTNQGQLKQMDNEIGDLKESVGKDLLPAMLDVKRATMDFYMLILNNESVVGASITNIANLISDTIIGWDHLLGGGKRTDAQQKAFADVGAAIKKNRQEVNLMIDSLESLEKRGIESGDEYDQFTRKFEKNSLELANNLSKLEELKGEYSKGNKAVFESTNGTIDNTKSKKENTEATEEQDEAVKALTTSYGGLLAAQVKALAAKATGVGQEMIDEQIARENAQEQLKESAISSAMDIANSVMAIKNAQAQQEIQHLNEQMRAEIGTRNMSGRARNAIEKKYSKEREKIQKEQAEKNRKLQVAQALVGLAQGVAGVWSQDLGRMGSFGVPFAIATSALLAGTAAAQIGAMKAQAFADGGVVDGFGTPSSSGPDNRMATVRSGERILNAQQQSRLDDVLFGNGNGGGSISVSIENFKGGDDELANLKDMLLSLHSNNQLQDIF